MKVVTEVPDEECLNLVTLDRDEEECCTYIRVNSWAIAALTDEGNLYLECVGEDLQADMPGMQFDKAGRIKVLR